MAIEDILMFDETVFQNINAFNPDYMPANYNFRDSQMEGMAMSIRPAMRGGRPTNSVVLGSCATGKTTAVKKVFELVERNSDKVICCYINCQLHTTRFGIFSQIHKKIFGHQPPETGVPFSRVYEKVIKHLVSEDKALIVALDDVDYLFQSQNANKVFYDILRAYEEFPGVRTGIFAILSDLEFRYALDKNVNTNILTIDEEDNVTDVLVHPDMAGECNICLDMFVMKTDFLKKIVGILVRAKKPADVPIKSFRIRINYRVERFFTLTGSI